MRHILKPLRLFLLVMVMTLLPVCGASAASAPTGNTQLAIVEGSIKNKSVTLQWNAISGASGYNLYQMDLNTNKLMKRYTTTENKYTVKKLTKGKDYCFYVKAFNSAGESSIMSNIIDVTPGYARPSAPTGFTIREYGTGYRILNWTKAKGAAGHLLYISDSVLNSSGKVQSTTVKVQELGRDVETYTMKVEKGHSYTFYLVGFNQYLEVPELKAGEDPNVPVKPTRIISRSERSLVLKAKYEEIAISTVHAWYLHATVKSTTTATDESGKKVTVYGGTGVTATAYTSGSVVVILSTGKKVTMSGSNLTYGNLSNTWSRYTTQQAENFVNTRGYTSVTDWLIWCNEYTTVTYLFRGYKGHWDCVREMDCVVGTYRLTKQGVRKITKKGYKYGDVAVFFGGNAFHRRWATTRGVESSGCVRLGTSDLHYMYDNVPVNTTAVFY